MEDDKGLEESLALARQIEADETKAQEDELQALHDDINQVEGESISSHVNQAYVEQLSMMGFSKIVCEKALFMTGGNQSTVEKALDWISAHSDDPDFNEELRIVGQSDNKPKSTLTKEEKLLKAKEL